jgi:hypothetical protein
LFVGVVVGDSAEATVGEMVGAPHFRLGVGSCRWRRYIITVIISERLGQMHESEIIGSDPEASAR